MVTQGSLTVPACGRFDDFPSVALPVSPVELAPVSPTPKTGSGCSDPGVAVMVPVLPSELLAPEMTGTLTCVCLSFSTRLSCSDLMFDSSWETVPVIHEVTAALVASGFVDDISIGTSTLVI